MYKNTLNNSKLSLWSTYICFTLKMYNYWHTIYNVGKDRDTISCSDEKILLFAEINIYYSETDCCLWVLA